jgi:hypothetical protein
MDEPKDAPIAYAQHDWFPDGQPVVLRLMPEYNVEVPLFPQSDYTDALVPKSLLAKLMKWQEDFETDFHYETGWRSLEAKERWAAQASPLETELRSALAGKADLVVDLWPLLTPGE